MSEPSYLLFIDENPLCDDLKYYFTQFNITIVHQQLPPINKAEIPMAILLHCSVLRNEWHILQQLYITYRVPLLIVSDYPNEDVCIKALESGADDFIIKPICPRELHARISAIKRRVVRPQQQIDQEREINIFTHWRLYPASRRIFNDKKKQELLLSAGEYDLLLAFVHNPQCVLEREHLLQITKNTDLNPFDRRVDVQISRLRQKMEVDARKPLLIKTIRNRGYMFTAQVITIKENEANK